MEAPTLFSYTLRQRGQKAKAKLKKETRKTRSLQGGGKAL
jgi:hypothetical protein